MKWLSFVLLPLALFGQDSYSMILEVFPFGKKGEIEILTNESEQTTASNTVKNHLIKKGIPADQAAQWSSIGIIAEDHYLYLVRDAVRFPSGALGTYDRFLWKSALDGKVGVAVLPMLPDGRIVLNLAYRHATRAWEIELPRGFRDLNETNESAARRELMEETGCEIDKLFFLGEMNPDSGILGSTVPMYLGKVKKIDQTSIDNKFEAISGNPTFTLQELISLLEKGYHVCSIQGEEVTAYVRDSFLTYALFQALMKGHVKPNF